MTRTLPRTSQGMPGCMLVAAAVVLAGMCWRCAPAAPACAPDATLTAETAKAALDAHLVIATHVCDGYANAADCPQLKPILDDAAARREAWVRCH